MLNKKEKKDLQSVYEYVGTFAKTDEEKAALKLELPYVLGEMPEDSFSGESKLSEIFEKYVDLDQVPRAIKKNQYFDLLMERYKNMINYYQDNKSDHEIAIEFFFTEDNLDKAKRMAEILDEMSHALDYKIYSERFIEIASEAVELVEGTPLEKLFNGELLIGSVEYRMTIDEADFEGKGDLKDRLLELFDALEIYEQEYSYESWGFNIITGTIHKEIDRLISEDRLKGIDSLQYQVDHDPEEAARDLYLNEARIGALKLADTLKRASRKLLRDPKAEKSMKAHFSSLLEEITELGLKESATIIELAETAQRIENFLDAPFETSK